jgi:hypothetical protein
MAAKLYEDVCGNRYDEDENGDSYTGISQSSAIQPVVHLNSSRDRNDSDAQRAGTAALLGVSGTALPPPSRERDQSLFILPDDLPPFQRASTTEIFDTLSYSGFGPVKSHDASDLTFFSLISLYQMELNTLLQRSFSHNMCQFHSDYLLTMTQKN